MYLEDGLIGVHWLRTFVCTLVIKILIGCVSYLANDSSLRALVENKAMMGEL